MKLLGLHHVTAVSADAPGNHAFYTGPLGMRLVKKTVNQDDPGAYHLFYADKEATPGSDLTFFDWPVPRETRGTNSISRTALRVAGEGALAWWSDRLREHGVTPAPIVERDGRATLDFEDPEGQRLSLVDDGGAGNAHPWEKSPVPADRQIRGLGPVTLTVRDLGRLHLVLTMVMGMEPVREYDDPEGSGQKARVYAMGEGGPAAEVHAIERRDLQEARQGAGAVHHVAFRTPDEAEYHGWAEKLKSMGIPNSGEVDRFWFQSLYFREPNGILFEIATDGPGFAVDEPADKLGEKLVLAPFLEPHRATIEAALKPL
jgi:glyoxalase family protein